MTRALQDLAFSEYLLRNVHMLMYVNVLVLDVCAGCIKCIGVALALSV